MKKLILTVPFLFILIAPNALSQEKAKYWSVIEYKYLLGINDVGDSYNIKRSDNFNLYAHNLNIIFGYYLNQRISAGVGMGICGYHNPNINTLPLFADIRYIPFQKFSSLFIFSDVGGAKIINGPSNFGLIYNLGCGYKYRFRKNSLQFSIGYNLLKYAQRINNIEESRLRNSISFGAGFVFN